MGFLFPSPGFESELRRITGVIRKVGACAKKSLTACDGLRDFIEVGGGFEPPYPVLQTDA